MKNDELPIADYIGYTVSRCGIVRSKGKELKSHVNSRGYLNIWLSRGGATKQYRIHRLVAIAFIENKGNLHEVNHIDGNKLNNNVENLEWSTRSNNMKHAFMNGLHGNAKLSIDDVRQIRKRYSSGTKQRILASDYGVNVRNIRKVVNWETWKDVKY